MLLSRVMWKGRGLLSEVLGTQALRGKEGGLEALVVTAHGILLWEIVDYWLGGDAESALVNRGGKLLDFSYSHNKKAICHKRVYLCSL